MLLRTPAPAPLSAPVVETMAQAQAPPTSVAAHPIVRTVIPTITHRRAVPLTPVRHVATLEAVAEVTAVEVMAVVAEAEADVNVPFPFLDNIF